MFEQYKKTFWRMQLLIASVAGAMWVYSHVFGLALLFFVTMQVCSLVGVSWGIRLKRKLQFPGDCSRASPGIQGQESVARSP